jgi:hypothetical protein
VGREHEINAMLVQRERRLDVKPAQIELAVPVLTADMRGDGTRSTNGAKTTPALSCDVKMSD